MLNRVVLAVAWNWKYFEIALNSSKDPCFINNKSLWPLVYLTSVIQFQQTLKGRWNKTGIIIMFAQGTENGV